MYDTEKYSSKCLRDALMTLKKGARATIGCPFRDETDDRLEPKTDVWYDVNVVDWQEYNFDPTEKLRVSKELEEEYWSDHHKNVEKEKIKDEEKARKKKEEEA